MGRHPIICTAIICTAISFFRPVFQVLYKSIALTPPLEANTSKMAANPVALILGAGPRIGFLVAKKLASQGYKVAVVSRSGSGADTTPTESFLSLRADFTKPESIPTLFDAVKAEFQAPPSVVVYNAGARTVPPVEDNLFSNSAENLVSDFNVNVLSAYVTAQQAVRGWETLPSEVKKTFIYTGNIMNTTIMPMAAAVNLGIGKSASSYWIGLADTLYQAKGLR
jgi:NAD(P)-dependent dehydrogenase (short-subunit alcohol dehydrogenase family)